MQPYKLESENTAKTNIITGRALLCDRPELAQCPITTILYGTPCLRQNNEFFTHLSNQTKANGAHYFKQKGNYNI